METIKINATELAEILINNLDRVGSTSWDVYITKNGRLDIRHNTHDLGDWFEVYDFYSGYDELGDDINELAEWLKSDGIDLDALDRENVWNDVEFDWL